MRFMKHVTGVGLGTLQVFEDERKTRRLGGQPQAFWNHAWRDVHPANDFHLFMQPEAKSLSYVVGPGGGNTTGALPTTTRRPTDLRPCRSLPCTIRTCPVRCPTVELCPARPVHYSVVPGFAFAILLAERRFLSRIRAIEDQWVSQDVN
jgi:hypothetical protein